MASGLILSELASLSVLVACWLFTSDAESIDMDFDQPLRVQETRCIPTVRGASRRDNGVGLSHYGNECISDFGFPLHGCKGY